MLLRWAAAVDSNAAQDYAPILMLILPQPKRLLSSVLRAEMTKIKWPCFIIGDAIEKFYFYVIVL